MTIDPSEMDRLETKLRADHDAPGRAYHSFSHVQDCLAKLDRVNGLDAAAHRLLRYALLWHDSVYDPTRTDNEDRSADRAARELRAAGLPAGDVEEVRRLILLTKGHRVAPDDRLGSLAVSIDLSILGEAPERYRAYAEAIRREYAHVPDVLYRAGRKRVLESLLAADPLYPDPQFRERYEAQARRNMADEIASLG
jgi:predicted metal-dependent HD superfamily phosphohydrolase